MILFTTGEVLECDDKRYGTVTMMGGQQKVLITHILPIDGAVTKPPVYVSSARARVCVSVCARARARVYVCVCVCVNEREREREREREGGGGGGSAKRLYL